MKQPNLDKIKRYYRLGLYTIDMIEAMFNDHKITEEEYDYITK